MIVAENDALMRGIIRALLVRAEQQVFPVGRRGGGGDAGAGSSGRAWCCWTSPCRGSTACWRARRYDVLPGYAEVPIVMLTGL